MAARFPEEQSVKLRPRKGHDMSWSCEKHGDPIVFRCKKHKVCICHKCATKDHGQKPCELEDIEDVIFEMKGKVDDSMKQIEDGQKYLKHGGSEIRSCETLTSDRIKALNVNVNAAYQKIMQKEEDKEREDIQLINKEADGQIRAINENRDKRIEERKTKTQIQQKAIAEEQRKILSETKATDVLVTKKIGDLQRENKHNLDTMDLMVNKINRMKQDDKTLVMEAPQVITSLAETYNVNALRDLTDCLERIKCEIERVRFVEGVFDGKHYARIDGYVGKWELVKSFDIPAVFKNPCMLGMISKEEFCVIDGNNNDVYVTNTSTSHTKKVIDGRSASITSCAPVDSNTIVCGKWHRTSDSLVESITLYDRQWKVVRDIVIPMSDPDFFVYVDVDRDGMILAAEHGQSHIYVINPADGKIVDTLKLQGKEVRDAIQAFSSGDIIVPTGGGGFTIISRSGEEKAVIHDDEWRGWSECRVDRLTDTVYITHWNEKHRLYTVDQASSNGNIQAKRIVEYKDSDRSTYLSPCLVTHTGDLVACDGNNIFVYKKRFDCHI